MSETHVLLELASDPFCTNFQDLDQRPAFSVKEVEQKPNLLVRVTREPQWSQQHPDIMGPSSSFLYFGPAKTAGYLVYGNSPTQPMTGSIRQKKGVHNVRYFMTQSGKELKWKISDHRMECLDGRAVVAVWEPIHNSDKNHYARLTVKHSGLPIVTEIVTALILNRMAEALKW